MIYSATPTGCSAWLTGSRRLADSNCCPNPLEPEHSSQSGDCGATWPPLTESALARPNNAPTKSFVYFIADPARGLVKIGYSKDAEARLAALRREYGHSLNLVGALAGGRALEQELHEEFSENRVEGEWFSTSQRLVDLVEAMFDAVERHDVRDDAYADPLTPVYTTEEALAYLLGVSLLQARKMMFAIPYGAVTPGRKHRAKGVS